MNDGVLNHDQAAAGHSITPDYMRWQTGRNREPLGRDRLDAAPPCTPRSGTPSPSWRKPWRPDMGPGTA
ncbi:hypothetical protein AB0N17_42590 [Streptomyces sp. NPDC051133]|uniref:hypothetical protein n=1 Tax=Streptomyces sp. NPDC051133 TaxID=3155521 RepID=UPI00342A7952